MNQDEKAMLAWNKLVDLAISKSTCSYKELGDTLNIHHRSVRFPLALIQEYCQSNNLPPLTILVVNATGFPGAGFIAAAPEQFEQKKDEVYKYKWNDMGNPFDFARSGYSMDSLAQGIINNDPLPAEIHQILKFRGTVQIIFRKALLKVYKKRCCICGLDIEEVLEASHIIPYSDCTDEQKISVNNGLLLCSLHHSLFDAGILEINKKYQIKLKKFNSKNEASRKFVGFYQDRMITLPKELKHYPSKDYLVD